MNYIVGIQEVCIVGIQEFTKRAIWETLTIQKNLVSHPEEPQTTWVSKINAANKSTNCLCVIKPMEN